MKNSKTLQIVGLLFLLGLTGCINLFKSNETAIATERSWPEKIDTLPIGLNVINSPEVAYASANEKDPETRGKYKLYHTTTVIAIKEDLEIVEFGSYIWHNGQWVLRTIYGRPFNKQEFSKWYGCKNGFLAKGIKYADRNNWAGYDGPLDGSRSYGLWYFIAKNQKDKLFVGIDEMTFIHRLKQP